MTGIIEKNSKRRPIKYLCFCLSIEFISIFRYGIISIKN